VLLVEFVAHADVRDAIVKHLKRVGPVALHRSMWEIPWLRTATAFSLSAALWLIFARPANLVLVVMDNEEYATTGGQKTPTATGADLAAAAQAMRIESAVTVRTEDELLGVARPFQGRDRGAESPAPPGPLMIVAKVTESAPTAKPPLDYVGIKQRFMAAIGNAEC